MTMSNAEKQARWRERRKAKLATAELSRAELWIKVKPLVERLEATSLELRQMLDPAETDPYPYIEDKRIMAIAENPHRPGSNRHARFERYQVGQTIGQYRQECGPLGCRRVRRDIREGLITVG
jgi:hypothetical protein